MQMTEFIADLSSRKGRGRPGTFAAQFAGIMDGQKFVRHDFDTPLDLTRFTSNFRNHVATGRIEGVTMTCRKTSVYLVDHGQLSDEERATLSAAGIIG